MCHAVYCTDFYKTNPDRFYIRVGSYVPGLTKLELTTDGIHGRMLAGIFRPNYDTDGSNELNLTYADGVMLSPATLLITSGDDDYTFNGSGVDDGQDDATLLADFDSEIRLELPEIAGWSNVVARAMKPVKEIKIRTKFFSATGTLDPFEEERIKRQIETAKEIYRQMGISIIDVAPPTAVALPASYAAKTVLTDIETQALALVIKLQIPQFGMAPDEILVAFTDLGFSGVDVDQNNQLARVGGFVQNILPPVSVSLDRNQLPKLNTVAHELGHIFTKSGPHAPVSEIWRLMLPGFLMNWQNSYQDPRRFNFDEEKTLKKAR